MGSTLLTHGYLVTVDPERAVYRDGFVLIDDDRITELGHMDDLGERTADDVVDLHGMLTMPGLINGHNHHWASLFKNTGEGLLLFICFRPQPLAAGALEAFEQPRIEGIPIGRDMGHEGRQ